MTTWEHAEEILQMEVARQNRSRQRNTGMVPLALWEKALSERNHRLRPAPVEALLDLHLSLGHQRRVNHDHTIDFEGQNYEIAATARKSVTIVHHPMRKFWVVE